MSQAELHSPFKSLRGNFEKNSGIVMRKKKYRAPNGAVLSEGVQETYKVANPRDFTQTPPQGAELDNMRSFGDISRMTTEIIRSEQYSDEQLAGMISDEQARILDLRAQLEDFRTRFYAQFKRPDPEAPFEKKPQPGSFVLRRKQYVKLDTFIQAILRERLKK